MPDDSLPEQLRRKYKHVTNAEAYFFKSVYGIPSFRFHIPALGWEFSDGFDVGPNFKGDFFYNDDFFNLPPHRLSEAKYYVDQWKDQGELYAYIQFSAPGSETELLGEFLGRDDYNVSGRSGLLHETNKHGIWKRVNYVVGNAIVSKVANETEVTIRCAFLHKTAKFVCTPQDQLYHDMFDTAGRLTVQDTEQLHAATTVRWYHDHVVFQQGRDAKDITAFFFPNESSVEDPLGRQNNGKWGSVQWLDV